MSTQLMKVISRIGIRVRTAPRTNAPLVTDNTLAYGDVLEVKTNSCTEATNHEWWEHAQNPGWWSAAKRIQPLDSYMIPYQPPYAVSLEDSQAIMLEVITNSLQVRNQPRLGNTLVANQRLPRGTRLCFHNRTEADGFIWWEQEQHPGWWSASGSLQGGQTFMLPVDMENADRGASLNVPWITQIQTPFNIPNDCVHACIWMMLKYYHDSHNHGEENFNHTVETLYEMGHQKPNGTTNHDHLFQMAKEATESQPETVLLTKFGMPDPSEANFGVLKNQLLADRPVTLLVRYPSLHFANPSSGSFDHWIVLVGFSGNIVYLHDPLWISESQGARIAVDQHTLLQACADTHSTNLGLYGVY